MIAGGVYIAGRPDAVIEHVQKAESFCERTRGLLGRPALTEGEGLLLAPCNSIHTCFMGFPIDAVFMDYRNRVVKTIHDMAPFRFALSFQAASVLELRAGEINRLGIQAEDTLIWTGKK